MIKTGLEKLFAAIKSGRKIAQIKYSFLSPELEDIFFVIPTYQEASMISTLSTSNTQFADFFIFEILNQFVPIDEQREWLLGDESPAGLFLSTYKAIMGLSYPKDAGKVNQHLALARNNLNLFDSIFSVLVNDLKMNPAILKDMTLDEIIKTLAIGEKYLLENEMISEEINISGPSYVEPKRTHTILDQYRLYGIEENLEGGYNFSNDFSKFEEVRYEKAQDLNKKRQYINFEEENKKLEKALGPEYIARYIRDDIDPFAKEIF